MGPAALAQWLVFACVGARGLIAPNASSELVRFKADLLKGIDMNLVKAFGGAVQSDSTVGRRVRRSQTTRNVRTATCGGPTGDMVVVTGADTRYFPCLRNLVASISFWEPNMTIAAYDLGLTENETKEARSWKNVCWHKSNATSSLELKQYAWKPVIIREAIDTYGEVLWIDGGSSVRGPLKGIQEILRADGHFLVQGQDTDMKQWTRGSMFNYYNLNKKTFNAGPSFSGNLQGWVKGSEGERKIFAPTLACALDQACIVGDVMTGAFHRYDQSALSVNAYKSGLNITAHTELLAWSSGQLSPKCWEPSSMVVWTSRCLDNAYHQRCFGPH